MVPLKEGFPGMWSAIGRMLDRDDVEAGIPEMCAALDHLYYDSKNESIIESLTQVLQCNPEDPVSKRTPRIYLLQYADVGKCTLIF